MTEGDNLNYARDYWQKRLSSQLAFPPESDFIKKCRAIEERLGFFEQNLGFLFATLLIPQNREKIQAGDKDAIRNLYMFVDSAYERLQERVKREGGNG